MSKAMRHSRATVWLVAVVNDCLSREYREGNSAAATVLHALNRDLQDNRARYLAPSLVAGREPNDHTDIVGGR